MKEHEIAQVVVWDMVSNYKRLENAMPGPKYFIVNGKTVDEVNRENSVVLHGSVVDVIADLLEKKQYFGWYVSESFNQVTNSGNARVFPLYNDILFAGKFRFEVRENGLFIPVEKVEKKGYLDSLRTPEGFKMSASLLGTGGNLEEITSFIYGRNVEK